MTFEEVLVKRSVPGGHTHEQLSSVFGSPAKREISLLTTYWSEST